MHRSACNQRRSVGIATDVLRDFEGISSDQQTHVTTDVSNYDCI